MMPQGAGCDRRKTENNGRQAEIGQGLLPYGITFRLDALSKVMGTRGCNFLIIATARADSPPRRRCEIGGLVRVREEHQID
jgi:hypothetical protein